MLTRADMEAVLAAGGSIRHPFTGEIVSTPSRLPSQAELDGNSPEDDGNSPEDGGNSPEDDGNSPEDGGNSPEDGTPDPIAEKIDKRKRKA